MYHALASKIASVDLKMIQSHILQFLWRGRPPKVAFSTLCQDIKDGGLKATDVNKMYEALRMTWIRRLYTEHDAQWRQLLQARFKYYKLDDLLKNRNAKIFLNQANIPAFYKDILLEYQKAFPKPVSSPVTARGQSIWHNDAIKRNGKPAFNRRMYQAGIRIVDDLIGQDGSVIGLQTLQNKYPLLNVNFLTFHGITNAIPLQWKGMIRDNPGEQLDDDERNDCLVALQSGKKISIKYLRSQHIYSQLITRRAPTAQQKWVDEGFIIPNWQKIYELPYKCCISTMLQSLQFRVLNRYIPTRKFLCTRNVVGSRLCPRCFEVDSLQHFYYECQEIQELWNIILAQVKNIFRLPGEFIAVSTVLFGYVNAVSVVNLIILLGKQYVTNCKVGYNIRVPNKEQFLRTIVNQHNAEKIIATKHNKMESFWKKWEKIVDRDGDLKLR